MNHRMRIVDTIRREFCKKKVMVIGDLMVDEYISGNVKRISPEAPVPVLDYKRKERKAGGAANVACNVKELGADVYLSGVAQEDETGKWLRSYMAKKGIRMEGVIAEEGRSTIVKTRFATKGQQLLRIDRENKECIQKETQDRLMISLTNHIGELDAVILSDYQKGVLSSSDFIKQIISVCKEHQVLVAIDSKNRQISAFKDADFIKPNNLELEAAVEFCITDEDSLNKAGKQYLEESGVKCLIVTRGDQGISVFQRGKKRVDFPVEPTQVYDVTGAGDTVISTIVLALISGLSLDEAVWSANIAAASVISRIGTAAITGEELADKVYEK